MPTAQPQPTDPTYASLSPEEWRDAPVVLRTGAEPGPQPGRAWYRVATTDGSVWWVEDRAGCPIGQVSMDRSLGLIEQRAAEAVWSYWREEAAKETVDRRSGCFNEGEPPTLPTEPWRQVLAASRRQAAALAHLTGADFGHPQGAVLHTTTYAEAAWSRYLRLAARPGCALVVGQNPGPRGAMQTGVPFTDPPTLADLFGIGDAATLLLRSRPPVERVGSWRYRGDAKAPREESARRLWPAMAYAASEGLLFATPAGFAAVASEAVQRAAGTFFCVNATPIGILDAKGRNVSAESVGGESAALVERTSLEWLRAVIDILRPAVVVSVGNWARDHLAAVPAVALGHRLHLRHPSPLAGGTTEWARDAAPVLRRAAELVREGRAGGAS